MNAASPFAQVSPSPAPMIAQVTRDLDRIASNLRLPETIDLAGIAEAKVTELWESRVRVFISVLALRAARDEIESLGAAA
jgi:hypothetical protein